eukprot:12887646-Prorocentrum_lima.AAC.1
MQTGLREPCPSGKARGVSGPRPSVPGPRGAAEAGAGAAARRQPQRLCKAHSLAAKARQRPLEQRRRAAMGRR